MGIRHRRPGATLLRRQGRSNSALSHQGTRNISSATKMSTNGLEGSLVGPSKGARTNAKGCRAQPVSTERNYELRSRRSWQSLSRDVPALAGFLEDGLVIVAGAWWVVRRSTTSRRQLLSRSTRTLKMKMKLLKTAARVRA